MTKAFDRILIVMFENQYRSYVMTDPFMRKLARAGMEMTNFFGCFHPSQTNYVASLAGELCAVTNDTPPAAPLMQRTLVDLMETGGVSWKAYMEALPSDPWNPAWVDPNYTAAPPVDEYPDNGTDLARYFRKHNAFASFHEIQASEARWGKIVDDTQFWQDVAGKVLPEYSWFTPDIWNDGHYVYNTHVDTNPRSQLIPQMSKWLEHVFLGNIATSKLQGASATGLDNLGLNLDVDLLLTDPAAAWQASNVPEGTLLVVTFDEADYDATGYDTNYDGPNQIYTVLLGDMITPGSSCDLPLNHYSLIRTVERNWALGDLGKNDKAANVVRPLWGERFAWEASQPVGLNIAGDFAAADLGGVPHLVFEADGGGVHLGRLQGGAWDDLGPLQIDGLSGAAAFKLASYCGGLLLVWTDADGGATAAEIRSPGDITVVPFDGPTLDGSFALAGYTDPDTGAGKAMLAWEGGSGFLQSALYTEAGWAAPVAVNMLTDGPMALAQFGPSLFLVYKERLTRNMRMINMNLGSFNAFEALAFDDSAAPQNDTTVGEWAAQDFPVGHFAKKFAALQNDYQMQGNIALSVVDGEMRLIYRGAYADTPGAYEARFGLTGVLASKAPYSNGYGGLDQAGWTAEAPLAGVTLDPDSPVTATQGLDSSVIVWRSAAGTGPEDGQVRWQRGRYASVT